MGYFNRYNITLNSIRMFEITKKQKQERGNRQNLKMFTDLLLKEEQHTSYCELIIKKAQPKKDHLNYLRIATCLQINYLIQTIIDIHNKIFNEDDDQELQNKKRNLKQELKEAPKSIGDFKIGIIGGGVMGRLTLNLLLPYIKNGLNPKNILVSTRQLEDLKSYSENFGVTLMYDNELLAEESDILIICVPATLDNWIITDLRDPLHQRVNQLQRINPLVFITTSNMNPNKLKKLFDFPILSPIIRGQDIQILDGIIGEKECEGVEKKVSEIMEKQQNMEQMRQALQFMYYKMFLSSKNQSYTSSSYQYQTSKTVSLHKSIPLKSGQSSLKESKAKQSSVDEEREGALLLKQTIDMVLYGKNNSITQTFLVQSKKWRMTYHNYIA